MKDRTKRQLIYLLEAAWILLFWCAFYFWIMIMCAQGAKAQFEHTYQFGCQFDYGPGHAANTGRYFSGQWVSGTYSVTQVVGTFTIKSSGVIGLFTIYNNGVILWVGCIDSPMTLPINITFPWKIGGEIWVDWATDNFNRVGVIPQFEYQLTFYGT